MMRRVICALLIFSLAMSLYGCGKGTLPSDETKTPASSKESMPEPENAMPVLDKDGKVLGKIDSRAHCTAVEGGIFYSVSELKEYQFTADTVYGFFSQDGTKNILLGTVKDQGYEASYTRTELDGKVYTVASIGDPVSSQSSTVVLLAADLKEGTLKQHVVSEQGFPYVSMAVSDGKLLIMNHEMSEPKTDKIYEFDPQTEDMREVLSFSSDKDSLRGVCASEDGFYLLRLKIGGSENEMFIDRYDKAYSKMSERSVNETLIKAAMDGAVVMSRSDALNELGIHASRFTIEEDRYLFYANFGLTRLVIDLESGEVLFARDDIFSLSDGSGASCVYRMDFDPENVEEPFIRRLSNGRLEELSFTPPDTHRLIREVSHSKSGTWLVMTSDRYSAQGSTYAVSFWRE
ncbi:MAG: hypothetical protein IJM50_03440 [Lachnospiraceae bacterium]|nr:hypothetical protein [Lachnospiraceae bacterium]